MLMLFVVTELNLTAHDIFVVVLVHFLVI